jgi:hypothetical protein
VTQHVVVVVASHYIVVAVSGVLPSQCFPTVNAMTGLSIVVNVATTTIAAALLFAHCKNGLVVQYSQSIK